MSKRRGAKVGNRNAVLYKKASLPLRINGGLVELIDDYLLVVAGNGSPDNQDRKEVVEEAIRQKCTRPVEDQVANII